MKIQYVLPFDLTRTPIEADTDTDFSKKVIGTTGLEQSNKFLVSLWNQMNTRLAPPNSPDRIPWAYFPGRYCGKKSHVSVIGFAQTRIGEIYFAVMYKAKGNIDTLLYMRPTKPLKADEVSLINAIIDDSIAHKDSISPFLCSTTIDMHLKGVTMAEYKFDSFSIHPSKPGSAEIKFQIYAIDKFEAEQIALNKLFDCCAFLTVETNILCTFEDYHIEANSLLSGSDKEAVVIDDYIDYYPLTKDWKACLSKYGLMFLKNFIFINDRFQEKPDDIRYYISACKHCQQGLESENKLGESGIAALPTQTFGLVKRDQKRKVENSTSALMSYLSAMECVTAWNASHETCQECGGVKYKISQRVKDLATEFLGDYLGKVFHKLYGYRSKFLHAGKMASDGNTVHTLPLLSKESSNGLIGFGSFSVSIDGKETSVAVTNVKEWTFYTLRSYYQKYLMGRTDFADVFFDPKPFTFGDFPLKIHATSPEGAKMMKNIFVPVLPPNGKDYIPQKQNTRFLKKVFDKVKNAFTK